MNNKIAARQGQQEVAFRKFIMKSIVPLLQLAVVNTSGNDQLK